MSWGYSYLHTEPIFLPDVDLCSLDSLKTPHTLCNSSMLKNPLCNNFHHIEMTEEKKNLILNGHNALRDRLAYVESVANMIKLEWDTQLETMAHQWILRCKISKKDPWTMLPTKIDMDPSFKYTLIHQNIAFINSKYLPQYYELQIFRYWYMEKLMNKADTKVINKMGFQAVYFTRETNYSMLAWSRLQRVGCALGRYHDGFAMVCNYFPFQGYDTIAYLAGTPGSECPRNFPLTSVIFQNLCTASGHKRQVNALIMIVFIIHLRFVQ